MTNKIVLEPSTNTHTLTSKGNINVRKIDESTMVMDMESEGVVTHGKEGVVVQGKHGTIATEAKQVYKYTQKEKNPISGFVQNAFD